ncbi:MAG TPA: hypothetical protein VHE55_14735 [Fimbriimonadaceae bacterium]|nr:hypothetical protein [Fimbriimonadaceae bacterium]
MDEPKKNTEKLSKVWTHTLSVVGLLAAVVSIVSFFGIHPSGAPPETPRTPNSAKPDPSPNLHSSLASSPSKDAPPDSPPTTLRPKGIGTLHLDGQFTSGQPMLSTDAIGQATGVSAPLTLKDSKSARLETVTGAMVPVAVEANHLVCVWRKGAQFVHGLHMTAATPHIHLTTPGMDDVDVPTDADGRLNQTLVWPADHLFSTVEFAGPVEIDGHTLEGGVSFGDLALPSRFSLDLPKPGEILAAIKGEFMYPAGSDGRYVVVEAVPAGNGAPISWSVPLHGSESTPLRSSKGGTVDKGLYAIRVLCSSSAK